MPQTVDINRQIVLAERPKGQPDENTLQMATTEIPQPSAGEMLVRTVYLSLDLSLIHISEPTRPY